MPFRPLPAGHLLLRPLRPSDAPAILGYRSLSEVRRFQAWQPTSLGEVEEFIGSLAPAPDVPGTWFQLGLERRAEGDLVGDCGLRFPEWGGAQVELGLTVAPTHQGKGHGAAALGALLAYAFGPMRKHRVHASVDPANAAAIRLLERAGLRREGHLVESVWQNGQWADDLVYAMLEREWLLGSPPRPDLAGPGRAG